MINPPEIRSRSLRPEDALITWKWRNHAIVREHFSGHGQEVSFEDEQAWVHRQLQTGSQEITYCIEDAMSGSFVGMTFLKKIDYRNRQAEFAILIDPMQAGRGYGTSACRMTLHEAFVTHGLHRVFLKVRTDNEAAIRLYTACGFVKEGTLRDDHFKNGKFFDQFIMSVIEPGR